MNGGAHAQESERPGAAPGGPAVPRRLGFRAARRAADELGLVSFGAFRDALARRYDRFPASLGRDGGVEARYARRIETDLIAHFGRALAAAALVYVSSLPAAADTPERARLRALAERASGLFWRRRRADAAR